MVDIRKLIEMGRTRSPNTDLFNIPADPSSIVHQIQSLIEKEKLANLFAGKSFAYHPNRAKKAGQEDGTNEPAPSDPPAGPNPA